MTPTEKHRETAQMIVGDAHHWRGPSEVTDMLALAIAKAEREGMKRAAEIARTVETPEDGEYWIANRIATAILSEAGESE